MGIDNELGINFPNREHELLEIVELHAKGFKNKDNSDLMNHYLRM